MTITQQSVIFKGALSDKTSHVFHVQLKAGSMLPTADLLSSSHTSFKALKVAVANVQHAACKLAGWAAPLKQTQLLAAVTLDCWPTPWV